MKTKNAGIFALCALSILLSSGYVVAQTWGGWGGVGAAITGTVTAVQGTAASLAAAWPVKMTDGTNVLGTYTNPVRTDTTASTSQPVVGASYAGSAITDNRPILMGGASYTTACGGVNCKNDEKVDGYGNLFNSPGFVSPAVPGTITIALASTSYSLCALTPGIQYRLACNVPVAYRTGAATPTAVSTDNPLGAIPDREDAIILRTGETCIAVISTGTGACSVSARQ